MQTLPNRAPASDERRLPRLGQINFVNVLPVVLPMMSAGEVLAAEVVFGTPSELNRQYALGALDAGAMSSFFYLQRDDLTLIPGPSISSTGEVGSVLFFAKKELSQLRGGKVAVPEASATSINLLKILLLEQHGVAIDITPEARPDIRSGEVDGALVMGDHALTVDEEWSKQYLRVDMGAWWYETCRLPMVFGVWAAREEWALENAEAFSAISSSLKNAVNEGLTTLFPEVVAETQRRLPHLTPYKIRRYFHEQLDFSWSPLHERGLNHYRLLCARHGLLAAKE